METLKLYLKPRLLAIFFIGFASGLPMLLTASTLTTWLSREGIDRTSIGLFAAVSTPYSLKFLWSFAFDHIKIPFLTKKLGRRTSWLLVTQIFLMLAIILLGLSNPKINIMITVIAAFLVSFFSASQDIVIDAYRIEILETNEQAAGAAMNTYGYRIAMFVAGAGSLILVDKIGSWHIVYFIMASISLVGIMTVLLNGEPKFFTVVHEENKAKTFKELFIEIVVKPFQDFASKDKWLAILIFVILYKMPDAIIASMLSNFYVSMGFTNTEIAVVVKSFGFAMTMIGIFLGGLIYYRFGVMKTLLISSIILPLSNLVFILQNNAGNNLNILYFVIANENLAGSISNVVIVAYLSSLCSKNYTATQYALLASVATVGRTFFAMPSGYLVENYGWNNFFIVSCLIGIPGIITLLFISPREKL